MRYFPPKLQILLPVILLMTVFGAGCNFTPARKNLNTNTIVPTNKNVSENQIIPSLSPFVYQKESQIFLYKPSAGNPELLLDSPGIVNHDWLNSQSLLVYTLKEEGFESNSDIFVKDFKTNNTERLTPKDNTADLNPKISLDGQKIFYIQREYNPSTKKVSDGDLWFMDREKKTKNKIFSSKPIIGLEEEEGCVTEEEKRSVKIGVKDVHPKGNIIEYWMKDWAPECSGLLERSYWGDVQGNDFLTTTFYKNNIFSYEDDAVEWYPRDIFWRDNDEFIVSNAAPHPFSGTSLYLFDVEQNRKSILFDSFLNDIDKDDNVTFENIYFHDDNSASVILRVYHRLGNVEYFIIKIELNSQIPDNASQLGEYFAVDKLDINNDSIYQIKFSEDGSYVIFVQGSDPENFGLFLHNIENKKIILVDSSKEKIRL